MEFPLVINSVKLNDFSFNWAHFSRSIVIDQTLL